MAVCPVTGFVYVVVMDRQSQQDPTRRVRLLQSTNGGSQWTSRIIGDLSGGQQFFPWVSVDPAGRVSLLFLHFFSGFYVDVYLAESVDFGSNFTAPVKITGQASDVRYGGGPGYHYQGATSGPVGYTYALWTDHRNATGGNPTGSDPYFARINLPPAPPQNVQVAATQPNQYDYRYPKVTWSTNSEPDLGGYEIWRKIVSAMDCGNGNWYMLSDTLGPSTQEYIDASIPTAGAGQCTAVYKFRARDEANNLSGYSNEASIQFGNDMWKANSTGRTVPAEYQLHTAFPNPFNP